MIIDPSQMAPQEHEAETNNKMISYEPVCKGVACDLSIWAMIEAAQKTGPSFCYELHVSKQMELSAMALLKKLAVDTIDNPFSPHINLIGEQEFSIDEWCLSANGKSFGSVGA